MTEYSSEKRKPISRAALESIRQRLLQPLRTNPPTIGTYPRELDVELFRLFSSDVSVVLREKSAVTLGGQEVRRKREVWVYETPGMYTTDEDRPGVYHSEYITFGEVQKDGTFLAIPKLTEVPHYTSNFDAATSFKDNIVHYGRRLLIEEIEYDDHEPSRWRARLVDESDETLGEGETYDCGASVVLATISALLANDRVSYWIEVTGDLFESAARPP